MFFTCSSQKKEGWDSFTFGVSPPTQVTSEVPTSDQADAQNSIATYGALSSSVLHVHNQTVPSSTRVYLARPGEGGEGFTTEQAPRTRAFCSRRALPGHLRQRWLGVSLCLWGTPHTARGGGCPAGTDGERPPPPVSTTESAPPVQHHGERPPGQHHGERPRPAPTQPAPAASCRAGRCPQPSHPEGVRSNEACRKASGRPRKKESKRQEPLGTRSGPVRTCVFVCV